MKRIISYVAVAVVTIFFAWSCSKTKLGPDGSGNFTPSLVVNKAALTDSVLSNNEMTGRLFYNQIKYYLGTVDLSQSLPEAERKKISAVMAECYKKIESGRSYDQMVDELVSSGRYTANVGVNMKAYQHAILDFLISNRDADSKTVWDFCLKEEKKVRINPDLSFDEKNTLLLNHTLIRNALKYKEEQLDFNRIKTGNIAVNSVRTNGGFWSDVACFVGQLSQYVGYAVGLFTSNAIVIAATDAAAHYASSTFQCEGTTNTVDCHDPLAVSFPYTCYTFGDPLVCTAVGFGTALPQPQLVFDFRYNDNLSNNLYSNFTNSSDNVILPGSYIVNNSVYDLAIQCRASCSQAVNPKWFGWINIADLGKPFFSISGNGNFSVADAAYYPSFSYTASGPFIQQNATTTKQWVIIPSGYPNYSATGRIVSSSNDYGVAIKWDAHAGFATVQCTMTASCGATVVQTFGVHIY